LRANFRSLRSLLKRSTCRGIPPPRPALTLGSDHRRVRLHKLQPFRIPCPSKSQPFGCRYDIWYPKLPAHMPSIHLAFSRFGEPDMVSSLISRLCSVKDQTNHTCPTRVPAAKCNGGSWRIREIFVPRVAQALPSVTLPMNDSKMCDRRQCYP
jgi:hypothetical protein